jgi:hypothetical protein
MMSLYPSLPQSRSVGSVRGITLASCHNLRGVTARSIFWRHAVPQHWRDLETVAVTTPCADQARPPGHAPPAVIRTFIDDQVLSPAGIGLNAHAEILAQQTQWYEIALEGDTLRLSGKTADDAGDVLVGRQQVVAALHLADASEV